MPFRRSSWSTFCVVSSTAARTMSLPSMVSVFGSAALNIHAPARIANRQYRTASIMLPLQFLVLRRDPRGLVGLALVGHAQISRPAVNPGETALAGIVLLQLVRIIAQSLLQRDEAISATAKHRQQVGHAVGIQLT